MDNKLFLLRKFGFTLAEVLITLAIIGIVAALKMPNLIVKYQKRQTVTQLKKAYSALSQAFASAQAENGPVSSWTLTAQIEGQSYGRAFLKYLLPYFKDAKIKYNIYAQDAMYKKTKYPTNFKGEYIGVLDSSWLETSDGMFIEIGHINWQNPTFFLFIDINGSKKPNVSGKDIFYFMISGAETKKLVGYNLNGYTRDKILESNCCKNCSGDGKYCSTVILKDSWEMGNDYPW